MKFKYLIISLIVLALATGAVIAAEQATVGDYTFTVPDGFTVTNQTEDTTFLQIDDDHAIVISAPEAEGSPEQFKAELEKDGYEFGSEGNYTTSNYTINQYNYVKDDYQGYFYVCHTDLDPNDADEDLVMITYVIPADEDAPSDDNPVNQIIGSLAKADIDNDTDDE